jgi:hypothetical protein
MERLSSASKPSPPKPRPLAIGSPWRMDRFSRIERSARDSAKGEVSRLPSLHPGTHSQGLTALRGSTSLDLPRAHFPSLPARHHPSVRLVAVCVLVGVSELEDRPTPRLRDIVGGVAYGCACSDGTLPLVHKYLLYPRREWQARMS